MRAKMQRFLALLLAMCLLTGCQPTTNHPSKGANDTMLTQDQLRVLQLAGRPAAEDGAIFLPSSDRQLLAAADFLWAYLAEKYPSHTFALLNCNPPSVITAHTSFSLCETSSPDAPFEVQVQRESDSAPFVALDTFYPVLILPEYRRAILAHVSPLFDNAALLPRTEQFFGAQFTESTPLSEAMKLPFPGLRFDTWIFVYAPDMDAQRFDEAGKAIRQAIETDGLRGDYTLCALAAPLPDDPGEPELRRLIRAQSFAHRCDWKVLP